MSFKAFSEKAMQVIPGTLSCDDFLTIQLLCYVMLCHVMSCHVSHRIDRVSTSNHHSCHVSERANLQKIQTSYFMLVK